MADLQVAQTILAQLGGNRFIRMTGARNMAGGSNSLHFALPGKGFARHCINSVKVHLDPADTYTMTFYRILGTNVTMIEKCEDVYCDMLQDVFTRVTGLHTHL